MFFKLKTCILQLASLYVSGSIGDKKRTWYHKMIFCLCCDFSDTNSSVRKNKRILIPVPRTTLAATFLSAILLFEVILPPTNYQPPNNTSFKSIHDYKKIASSNQIVNLICLDRVARGTFFFDEIDNKKSEAKLTAAPKCDKDIP